MNTYSREPYIDSQIYKRNSCAVALFGAGGAAGVGGKPTFADTFTLFEDFDDAPEAGEGGYGKECLPEEVGNEQGGGAGGYASCQEYPPTTDAEVVFPFYHQGMEYTYYKEAAKAEEKAGEVVLGEEFCHFCEGEDLWRA